jgi:orotidine-5'-phosphate decarboxylase
MLQLEAFERILPAFDKSSVLQKDYELMETIQPFVAGVKIGLEAINAPMPTQAMHVGDNLRKHVQSRRMRVMWDVKLNDIPNTVGGAVANITRKRVWGITIMASAGVEAVKAAVANRADANIIGVTVLTSLKEKECRDIYGRSPAMQVAYFAGALVEAGAQAIVCSPLELDVVRKVIGDKLFCITPGIRSKGAAADDQNRTMTAGDAIRAGADYLVIGRPIMGADDPVKAARDFCDEIAAARANLSTV